MKILKEVPSKIDSKMEVSIDLEIYGMQKGKLHRPNQGTFASLQICPDGETVYLIEKETDVPAAIESITECTHIFHNAAFDVRHLRRWCKYPYKEKLFDTMLIERLLWGGYYDSFALKDLSRRYLDEYVDKAEREEFSTAESMTNAMIEYACKDAILTWKIWQKQKEILTEELELVWEYIDKPALFAILDMKGFRMDVDKWIGIANGHKKIEEEIEATLSFNPRSPKQVLSALQTSGLRKLTSTSEKELLPYKEYPLVQKILTLREHAKKASTYGVDFIAKHVEEGYIYPEIEVTRAETGRMSSSSPNIQQIPSDKEYRDCFLASEGSILLVADYSSQEPRITAYESKDPAYLEVVKSGDIHTEVGKRLFRKNITKSSPLRKQAKALNLGLTYGLTPRGLMIRVNSEAETEKEKISLAEAEQLVRAYFTEFSGIQRWIDVQRQQAKKKGYVTTKSGRRVHINHYSYSWMNNAINSPIQGGAADVTKRALSSFWMMCNEQKIPFPVIAIVHDEIVCDVPEAMQEQYKQLLETAMVTEAELIYDDIPFEVEIHSGKTWACK